MNKGISIILCCYNSASRLPETLQHVIEQKVREDILWEIIVVDNASTDNTAALSEKFLSDSKVAYQVVAESNPGLSNARAKGFAHSKYEYLLYCDDDNWLAPDYVQKAWEIMEEHPEIAILGGMGEAVFEDSEPSWFKNFGFNFAVGYLPETKTTLTYIGEVSGAGFIVRRKFLEQLNRIGFKSLLSDRSQQQLISGGDTELCYAAGFLGYKIAYHQELKFKHFMPKPRMTWNYLKKLYFGFGRSNIYTRAYLQVSQGNDPSKLKLRYPLWLDTWVHKAKDTALFYPKVMFKMNEEGNGDVLRFLAMRGELSELWNLKERYTGLFQTIQRYMDLFNKEAGQ